VAFLSATVGKDTDHLAGRLYDRLADRFGEDRVFMDMDKIEPGVDFAEEISQAVAACQVLVAVVGPAWLTATDERGRRRLDDPGDFVRLEIETALTRDVRVIPVLAQGAVMPGSRGRLPPVTHVSWTLDPRGWPEFWPRLSRPGDRHPRCGRPARPGRGARTARRHPPGRSGHDGQARRDRHGLDRRGPGRILRQGCRWPLAAAARMFRMAPRVSGPEPDRPGPPRRQQHRPGLEPKSLAPRSPKIRRRSGAPLIV
jgi:TIR domain